MESVKTALERSLEVDRKRLNANRYATQIAVELHDSGFLAKRCMREAIYHLTELFYKHGVEITTEEQRRAEECLKPR